MKFCTSTVNFYIELLFEVDIGWIRNIQRNTLLIKLFCISEITFWENTWYCCYWPKNRTENVPGVAFHFSNIEEHTAEHMYRTSVASHSHTHVMYDDAWVAKPQNNFFLMYNGYQLIIIIKINSLNFKVISAQAVWLTYGFINNYILLWA